MCRACRRSVCRCLVTPNLTHRLFQIEGESMLPIPSGSYILSTYEEDWHRAGGMRPYIVVTRNDGVVFKRIENRLDSEHKDLWLISDNPDYPPYFRQTFRGCGGVASAWVPGVQLAHAGLLGHGADSGNVGLAAGQIQAIRQGARAGRYPPRPPLR